jgi:hypothetical protein
LSAPARNNERASSRPAGDLALGTQVLLGDQVAAVAKTPDQVAHQRQVDVAHHGDHVVVTSGQTVADGRSF